MNYPPLNKQLNEISNSFNQIPSITIPSINESLNKNPPPNPNYNPNLPRVQQPRDERFMKDVVKWGMWIAVSLVIGYAIYRIFF